MAIIAPGTTIPDFVLKTADGEDFTPADLDGRTTVLVFYPFAFSPVCTDQLQIYDEVIDDIAAKGATVYGVSTDASPSQSAFQAQMGVSIQQLSDFEPKGATAKALGAFFEPGGMTNRALVIIGPDRTVTWSHLADSPGDLPGVNLLFDNL